MVQLQYSKHAENYYDWEDCEDPTERLAKFNAWRALRLRDAYPDHYELYRRYFIDYWPKGTFYQRRAYITSWHQPKIKKGKRAGKPLSLHIPGVLEDCLDKHLDYARWCEFQYVHHGKSYSEEPYWFGMTHPRRTSLEAIDLDNKRVLGWYDVEWRTEEGEPRKTARPATRLPLDYLRRIKTVFDNFPARIWCVSSATLGMHAWLKHPRPVETVKLQQARLAQLRQVDVTAEVHPMPGRCLRRPFGLDYVTISPAGVLTCWTEQLEFFHQPTPITWDRLFLALRDVALEHWQSYLRSRAKQREDRYETLTAELARAEDWYAAGCPPETTTTTPARDPETTSTTAPARQKPSAPRADCATPLRLFGKGQYAISLLRLVKDGLPEPDRLFDYCLAVGKYLWWVELHHQPVPKRAEQIDALLWRFVSDKHNGMISRLDTDASEERDRTNVRGQIQAILKLLPEENEAGQTLFAKIRERQSNGAYRGSPYGVIRLAPYITGELNRLDQDIPSSSSSSLLLSVPLSTPLPAPLAELVKAHSGRCKALPFATEFLTFVLSHGGKASVGRDRLLEMLGTNSLRQLATYKRILTRAGLITEGGYVAHRKVKSYALTPKALAMLKQPTESAEAPTNEAQPATSHPHARRQESSASVGH